MEAIASGIRDAAKKLISEGKVDCVIGFAKGTVPMRDRPYFAYTAEEAENLTFSSFCANNLANFLVRREKGETGKVAIVAQGCVSRNIVNLINENQIAREDVYIIGVASPGMVDKRRVEEHFAGKTITAVAEEGDELVVTGKGFTERLPKKNFFRQNCLTCQHRNPVIVDEMIGGKEEETHGGDLDAVAALWEKLGAEDRWAKFQDEILDKCIRCYACRDACPLCYCHVCFVDETRPQWCGKTQDEADVATFHVLRAFHCAGRCTDCGACESACPQGLKMRRLTMKIEKDIRELYGFEAGMEIGATPPMSLYKPDDPQEFIK